MVCWQQAKMLYKYRGSLHTRMRTHTPPDEQNQSSGTAELIKLSLSPCITSHDECSVGNPSQIRFFISLFPVPGYAMPVLRIARLVGKRSGRSILYNFERLRFQKMKGFIAFPHDVLKMLSDSIVEGVANVIMFR